MTSHQLRAHNLETEVGADPTWAWPDRLGPWGLPLLFLLTVVAYGAGSQFALRLMEASGLQGVIYLPSGVTVAFLLRLPRRWWWVVLFGAGLTEFLIDFTSGYSYAEALGYTVANVAEPLLGGAVVLATCGAVDLTRRRHVFWYTLGAVILAPAVAAAIGAGADRLLAGDDFVTTFYQWWLGDALGVILMGSAILAWGSSRDRQSVFTPWGALLVVASATLTVSARTLTDLPVVFASLIGVVIAGALFGVRAVTITSLAIAIALALAWGALIMGLVLTTALVLIKLQIGTFALAGLFIAAESHERERATREAAVSEMKWAALAKEQMRDRDLAVQIQQGLLPGKVMRKPGIEIAAGYTAAAEAFEVGGDWYDTIQLKRGRIGLVVGDIVGHGIEAMTSMGRLRTALAALAMHNEDPASALAEVDDFAGSPDGAEYATVFYAILDSRQRTIQYASAGHPPALLVAPDGSATWLDKGQSGPLYGKPSEHRPHNFVPCEPGTTIVLYSDGLIERRGESLEVGMDRLQRLVTELSAESAQSICDKLFERLGAEVVRGDDAVVLVVKTHPDRKADYHEWFAAEPTELRNIRSSIRSWTAVHDLLPQTRDNLLILVGEAASNAVRHAYRGDPSGQVEIRITVADGELNVEVADTGRWRTRPDDVGEPGMGMALIRSVADDVHIETAPYGTLVAFSLPLHEHRSS